MPCAVNALLNDKGIPVVCETDIHGAITSLMVEAAGMGESRSFFADWTIRHPDNPNGELLQHCGPWPISIAKGKAKLTYPLAFSHPGSITAEAKIVEKNQSLLAYKRESSGDKRIHDLSYGIKGNVKEREICNSDR